MPIYERILTSGVPVNIFARSLDQGARLQLIDLAESGFVEGFVAAMPDAHFGMGACVGSVFASETAVCPNAVGIDIGCGMATVRFSFQGTADLGEERLWEIHRRIKAEVPTGLAVHAEIPDGEAYEDSDHSPWLATQLNSRVYRSLGTLGSGNHFIELERAADGTLWCMLHSGSRNIGKLTAEHYDELAIAWMKSEGIVPRNRHLNWLSTASEAGRDYLRDMGWCQRFALANRAAMLRSVARIVDEVAGAKADWDSLVNVHHNYSNLEKVRYLDATGAAREKELWITRKGATSARDGERGLIPGSMAKGSWIVEGRGNWESWYSSSHGAGRAKSRAAAFAEIKQEEFERSMQGVVAETVPELRDEAPQAYKDLDSVMEEQSDLIQPYIRLMPLLNIKGWDASGIGQGHNPWQRARLPVTIEGADAFGIEVGFIEVPTQAGTSSSPTAAWVESDAFAMKPPAIVGTVRREFWVKARTEATHKHLLACILIDSTDKLLRFRVVEVKRKQRL